MIETIAVQHREQTVQRTISSSKGFSSIVGDALHCLELYWTFLRISSLLKTFHGNLHAHVLSSRMIQWGFHSRPLRIARSFANASCPAPISNGIKHSPIDEVLGRHDHNAKGVRDTMRNACNEGLHNLLSIVLLVVGTVFKGKQRPQWISASLTTFQQVYLPRLTR